MRAFPSFLSRRSAKHDNSSKMIYARSGVLFENEFQKSLKLFDGRIINIDKSKINLFNFDQIDFNLKDLNTKTITVPKVQEIDLLL